MPNEAMTLGSLFDGAGGFPLGGILAGITPVWSSEIEPFPILVTHKRLPSVKHYGDVSRLSGAELEPVDIITFGSPCQDLSVAGKRAGLHDGERSSLFFQAIRIIKEMRDATNGAYPRYCVWENVPGAFSSNSGDDFRAVLEAVIGVKEEWVQVPPPQGRGWPKADVYLGTGWSVAYRTFDSQYWGVPQRRARIYLVADFDGESAGEVLFKSEGLSGYSAQGIRAWQRAARCSEESTGETGEGRICVNPQGSSGLSITEEQTGTLVAQDHGHHPAVLQSAGFCTEHSAKARSIGYEEEKSPTLRAGTVPAALAVEHNPTDSRLKISEDGVCQTICRRAGTGGNNVPLVAEPVSYGIGREAFNAGAAGNFNFAINEEVAPTMNAQGPGAVAVRAFGVSSKSSYGMLSDNPHAGFYEAKTSRTLDQKGGEPSCAQGGICVVSPEPIYAATVGNYMTVSEETAQPLMARDFKDPQIVNEPDGIDYIVRRLTPVECARLQGFPDWWCFDLTVPDPTDEEVSFWKQVWDEWTQVSSPGKKLKTEKQVRKWLASPCTDAAEYKLWGNSLTVNIVYFVLSGILWAASKDCQ